jgi:PPP family 3-phenylpropionic acid transporter
MQKHADDPRTAFRAGVAVAAVYAALFLGFAVHMSFFPLWLQERGLSPEWVALVLALPMLTRPFALPVLTWYAGRMADLRRALMLYSAVTGLAAAFYPVAPGLSAIVMITLVMGATWNATIPLMDAVAIQATHRHARLAYGGMRLWGSVSFLAGTIAMGVLVDHSGAWVVVPALVASLALLTALAPTLPASAPSETRPRFLDGWRRIFGVPGLGLLLVGAACVQSSHGFLHVFGSIHWKAIGHSETLIGVLWATSVLAEIVLFFYAQRIVGRFGAGMLLMAGTLAGLVRWTAMGFDPGLAATFALMTLHAFTFGAVHVATVTFLGRHVAPGDAAIAQGAYFTMLGVTNGATFLASGPLYASLGVTGQFVMAAIAGAGVCFAAAGLIRLRRAQPQRAGTGGSTVEPR